MSAHLFFFFSCLASFFSLAVFVGAFLDSFLVFLVFMSVMARWIVPGYRAAELFHIPFHVAAQAEFHLDFPSENSSNGHSRILPVCRSASGVIQGFFCSA